MCSQKPEPENFADDFPSQIGRKCFDFKKMQEPCEVSFNIPGLTPFEIHIGSTRMEFSPSSETSRVVIGRSVSTASGPHSDNLSASSFLGSLESGKSIWDHFGAEEDKVAEDSKDSYKSLHKASSSDCDRMPLRGMRRSIGLFALGKKRRVHSRSRVLQSGGTASVDMIRRFLSLLIQRGIANQKESRTIRLDWNNTEKWVPKFTRCMS